MDDPAQPPDGSRAPFGSPEQLRTVWEHFRAGNAVVCPGDGAPLALAVDGTAVVYRFVCTRCGAASEWFESDAAGIRIGGNTNPGQ
jgi:hypothetical protein